MVAVMASPLLKATRQMKPPEPTAALLALQEKGLELPSNPTASIPPYSNPSAVGSLHNPALSGVLVPLYIDKYLPQPSHQAVDSDRSSTTSMDTILSKILNLYANLSEQSLRSEYGDASPRADNYSDDEPMFQQTVHQPRAYRDMIAPLLEHQFSGDILNVPPGPSPMSTASMPMLVHPNANISVRLVTLSPEISPHLQPINATTLSRTSIQITPEMSPLPQDGAPTFAEYSQHLAERRIALEVPDVRDADSWYDQPLSPVSPEEIETRLRESVFSAVSPEEIVDFDRRLGFDVLPPNEATKTLDQRDNFLPRKSTRVENNSRTSVTAPTWDSGRDGTKTTFSAGSSLSISHTNLDVPDEAASTRQLLQRPSLIFYDPIEGPLQTYLATPPLDNLSGTALFAAHGEPLPLGAGHRPRSAFSDTSSDSYVIQDTLRSHLKQVWRETFRKRDKRRKPVKTGEMDLDCKISQTKSEFDEDLESYKYPYWQTRASTIEPQETDALHGTRPSVQSTVDHDRFFEHHTASSTSVARQYVGNHKSLPLRASPESDSLLAQTRRREPQAAVPLTKYQKYGPEIWYESSKKKRAKRREQTRKEAAKAEKKASKLGPKFAEFTTGTNTEASDGGHDDQPSTTADVSQSQSDVCGFAISSENSTDVRDSDMSFERGIQSNSTANSDRGSPRKSGRPSLPYNNDLFEASGGARKRKTLTSRLLMSSEEKRRQKIKESITIVGAGSFVDGRFVEVGISQAEKKQEYI